MHTRTTLAGLMALALTAALAQKAPSLAEAHRAYYGGQYARALALYEQLAVTGDGEAAERAAFMRLLGSAYYGQPVQTDVAQATTLLIQAARAGRPGAGAMLNMLDGTD